MKLLEELELAERTCETLMLESDIFTTQFFRGLRNQVREIIDKLSDRRNIGRGIILDAEIERLRNEKA